MTAGATLAEARYACDGQVPCSPEDSPAPFRRWARKGVITGAGTLMLAVGVAMLVLPGPGTAVILAALAVLATEYRWAAKLLAHLKLRAVRLGDAALAWWRKRHWFDHGLPGE